MCMVSIEYWKTGGRLFLRVGESIVRRVPQYQRQVGCTRLCKEAGVLVGGTVSGLQEPAESSSD